MKKFVLKLVAFGATIVLAIIALHIGTILVCRAEMDGVYRLNPDQDVLFLGSSQMGCAIEESPRFHNKSIWMSNTISQSCLLRLLELERRGQLENVKVLAMPFHVFSITTQSRFIFEWAWYQELALTWRHLDMLPCTATKFLSFMVSNLRLPLAIHVESKPPSRPGLSSRPKSHQDKFYRNCAAEAERLTTVAGDYEGWERSFYGAHRRIKEICNRHGIRFVLFRAPVLPYFDHRIPESGQAMVEAAVAHLRDMGIEYVDTEHEIPEKYFFDNVHLIKEGATIFTEDLYRRMKIPIGKPRAGM